MHLDADGANGGAGGGGPEVDIGPQSVERHPPLPVPLAAAHVGTAEAAGALHPDSLGAGPHRGLHGTLHGTPERDPALQLVGDAAGQQLGVGLRILDLDDVDLDDPFGQFLEQVTEPLDLGTAAADYHTGAARVDIDLNLLVTDALDLDTRDGTPGEFLLEGLPDGGVFDYLRRIVGIAVPT
jgi:hypothetical protein